MKTLHTLIIMLLAVVAPAMNAREVKDVPNVQVADSTRFVSDPDGILSPATVSQLDATLGALRRQSTVEMAVALVEEMPSGTDIDTYATELFEAWGVGKKDRDNGLLLVISRSDRKAAIRTGYGMEGVVPDIVAGRVLRQKMFPAFRQGDYDGGVIAAVDELARVVTDPKYAAELKSSQPNAHGEPSGEDIWRSLLQIMIVLSVGFLIYVVCLLISTRKLPTVERYDKLTSAALPAAVVAALTLGMGVPALVVLLWFRHRIRNHTRKCSNCGAKMRKLDEASDNFYLTPAQDTEERINSVDYDVWLCNTCKQTDILPYRNRHSTYTPCPQCGAIACRMIADRILAQPTRTRHGKGEKVFACQSCGHIHSRPYSIAKLAAAPVIIGSGIGGSGGFGGGGFGGGGFGGGMTGGGGASGGW